MIISGSVSDRDCNAPFHVFLNLKIRKETNYEAYQGEADSSLFSYSWKEWD